MADVKIFARFMYLFLQYVYSVVYLAKLVKVEPCDTWKTKEAYIYFEEPLS